MNSSELQIEQPMYCLPLAQLLVEDDEKNELFYLKEISK